MDGSDDSFEAALQELCTYMCGPDGKTGVDAVDLNTLSDGQRHPEGTYELTLDGKLLLDADGKPRKIPRKKNAMDAEGECFDYAYESREQQEEEVIHGRAHPWKRTTLFRFRWWWYGIPSELKGDFKRNRIGSQRRRARREGLSNDCLDEETASEVPSNFLDDWCQWVAAPPIDPIASPVAFERK